MVHTFFFQHMKDSGKRLSISDSRHSKTVCMCVHMYVLHFFYGHGWREVGATECKWKSWLPSTMSVPDIKPRSLSLVKSPPHPFYVFCISVCAFPFPFTKLTSLLRDQSWLLNLHSCLFLPHLLTQGFWWQNCSPLLWAWPPHCTLAVLMEHVQLCLEDCVLDSTDHMPWWLCEVWLLCLLVRVRAEHGQQHIWMEGCECLS